MGSACWTDALITQSIKQEPHGARHGHETQRSQTGRTHTHTHVPQREGRIHKQKLNMRRKRCTDSNYLKYNKVSPEATLQVPAARMKKEDLTMQSTMCKAMMAHGAESMRLLRIGSSRVTTISFRLRHVKKVRQIKHELTHLDTVLSFLLEWPN